jgi:hypothetical protein
MKKLLTIMVLALALCLVCAVALAEDETYTFADFPLTTIKVDGVDRPVTGDNLAQANAAQHNKDDKYIHVRVYYNDDDGNSAYKEVAVDPHNTATFVKTEVKATCWTTGIDVYKCSVCGRLAEIKTKSFVDAGTPDHSAKWYNKVIEEATCAEEGKSGTYCPVCKVFKPGDYDTIPKQVHIYTGMKETKQKSGRRNQQNPCRSRILLKKNNRLFTILPW